MIDLDLFGKTPKEITTTVASNEKRMRKRRGYTQQELARRSGVSYASLRWFEQTGEISFLSLARIATILGCEADFMRLFAVPEYSSMEELLNDHNRKS